MRTVPHCRCHLSRRPRNVSVCRIVPTLACDDWMLAGSNVHWAVIHLLLYLFNSLCYVLSLPCVPQGFLSSKENMTSFYQKWCTLSFFVFHKKKIIKSFDILPVISQGHQEQRDEWIRRLNFIKSLFMKCWSSKRFSLGHCENRL